LTNQDKARHWLERFEEQLDKLAKAEDNLAAALKKGKITSQTEIDYQIYTRAQDNFNYKHAERKLKAYESRATMYALFALLDEAQE
jgi:hypothetical protein